MKASEPFEKEACLSVLLPDVESMLTAGATRSMDAQKKAKQLLRDVNAFSAHAAKFANAINTLSTRFDCFKQAYVARKGTEISNKRF